MSVLLNDDNGGPAFPVTNWSAAGMSLRDYFAAAALKGQCHRLGSPYDHRDILAADCYAVADEMLKAREAKP